MLRIARAVRDREGRALLVGGGVRDAIMGRPVHDWDVEVYGLDEAALREVLGRLGRVDLVGRSFGVFKLTLGGRPFDVSLPRRDSKVGAGHKGIQAIGDPHMGVREAARRRDLTVNAMLLDPLTGELLDPFDGRRDLADGLLREVDPDTFLEDPLRALRVAQFAARLGFRVAPSLVRLGRDAALNELPAERLQGEWQKLLLQGVRPSLGLAYAREAEIAARIFPTRTDDPTLDAAVDALVPGRDAVQPEGRRYARMLLGWLWATPPSGAEAALEALGLLRWGGYRLREKLLAALTRRDERPDRDADLRRLAVQAEPGLLFAVQAAAGDPTADARRARAATLGVLDEPPPALLLGRHLTALGVPPGPRLGQILQAAYAAQLAGDVLDEATALAFARDALAAERPTRPREA